MILLCAIMFIHDPTLHERAAIERTVYITLCCMKGRQPNQHLWSKVHYLEKRFCTMTYPNRSTHCVRQIVLRTLSTPAAQGKCAKNVLQVRQRLIWHGNLMGGSDIAFNLIKGAQGSYVLVKARWRVANLWNSNFTVGNLHCIPPPTICAHTTLVPLLFYTRIFLSHPSSPYTL